jgi:hypothetical protein
MVFSNPKQNKVKQCKIKPNHDWIGQAEELHYAPCK